MEFYEDGDEVVSFWNPKTHYQGWFDTMHGGILATIIDETAAWVIFRKLQTTGMTAKLELRYKKPVMTTEGQITVRGHIAEQRRNLVAVDVSAPFGADPIHRANASFNYYKVLIASSQIMQQHITQLMCRLYRPDVLAQMPADSYGMFEFYRAKELVAAGRKMIREVLARIDEGE